MFQADDLKSLEGKDEHCDICIVGSGPAGSTLLRELAGSALRIILVESGKHDRQAQSDDLNEIENVGAPRVLDQWLVRNRIVGGSSHTWMGRCAPFDNIDYQRRSWVPYSGWPFGPEELAPYFPRAAIHLGLSAPSGGRLSRSLIPGLKENYLEPFTWEYSCDTKSRLDSMRFGLRLMSQTSRDARVITDATVLHINTNDHVSAVRSVEVTNSTHGKIRIFASTVVLCTGGIENARLLLASNRQAATGLGNSRGLVGRFLMDHPRGPVATFDLLRSGRLQSKFGLQRIRTPEGPRQFRHGLRLSPAIQEREGLLNATAWLREIVTPDDPWQAVKRFVRGNANIVRDASIIAGNLGLLAKGLYRYTTSSNGLPRKLQGLVLEATSEQSPDPESRVTLSSRTDRYGMPLSKIAWKIGDLEQKTVCQTAELVAEEFRRLKFSPPTLLEWVTSGCHFPGSFQDVAHPTGTTRMSLDPSLGVVDGQGQVHGIAGLYIAGSSLFPTSSHANPTQMIVAMAVRLADFLKKRSNA